ncbi:hypothetical protein DESME_01985 [Desulfitobacterium metallireducens DSM 15288]|uniref:Uncharacterized protein n=1 Tax=Desulfitobacterium metallireducens DSM 15288 TaxID=871968 RepID=W0E5E8_9FIRM|nr:hypothetical protein DESME_01985 [Desulfitobacterium metallireducens DSM 15288]
MKTNILFIQVFVLLAFIFVLFFMVSVLKYIKKKKEIDKEIIQKLDSLLNK